MGFDPKKFLAETEPSPSPNSAGFDPKKFLAETAPQPETKPVNFAGDVVNFGKKALDYPGSLVRGSLAGAYQGLSGQDLGVSAEDVLKGNTPGSSELLKRAGVGEGKKLSQVLPQMINPYSEPGHGLIEKGGALDPNARGLVGLAGDIATDPTTYLAGPISEAAKGKGLLEGAAKVGVSPISSALEAGGERLYKSGLKNVDTRAIERGGEAVSPYLFKNGEWGRLSSIQKGMDQKLGELGSSRDEIYKTLDKTGAKVDPYDASEGALKYLQDLEKNPYMKPKVDAALSHLGLADKPMSLSDASAVKTGLYDSLPAEAFNEYGKLNSVGQNLNQKLSQGYRGSILDEATKHGGADTASKIDEINQEMGAYLNAQKPLKSEISKEGRKGLITQTKLGAAAINPLIPAGMYAAQLANATPVRTGAGLVLNRAGQNLPEGLLRQTLLNSARPSVAGDQPEVPPEVLDYLSKLKSSKERSSSTGQ